MSIGFCHPIRAVKLQKSLVILTNEVYNSITLILLQLNQVLAVCIVGYTAAMVSVVAGTVLAQECSQQISTMMHHLTSLDATSVPNNTLTPCSEESEAESLSSIIVDSLHSLAGEQHVFSLTR